MNKLLLVTSQLKVGYSTPLFPDLNLSIRGGEYWGLVGHNGSGKTTLLKTLLSITPKLGGDFTISAKIAYVPQRSSIDANYPMRAVDIISNGTEQNWSFLRPGYLQTHREKIETIMKSTKTDTLRNEPFGSLSEGQKQRVLIARAMVSEPELLILDEPTSAMDYIAESETLVLIDSLKEKGNLSILIVTHHLHTISDRVSHLIVVDRNREFSICGSYDKLKGDPKLAELYGDFFARDPQC